MLLIGHAQISCSMPKKKGTKNLSQWKAEKENSQPVVVIIIGYKSSSKSSVADPDDETRPSHQPFSFSTPTNKIQLHFV